MSHCSEGPSSGGGRVCRGRNGLVLALLMLGFGLAAGSGGVSAQSGAGSESGARMGAPDDTRPQVAATVPGPVPGLVPDRIPGPTNSLADVGGLQVGHWQRADSGYLSGTTVVLAGPEGATASVDVRGGAPGTRETDLLRPGGLVERVHAIVLSGGSAFGLDAASGVMAWLESQGRGFPVPGGVVPIVPSAILYDLGRGGDFGRRPDPEFGWQAAQAAARSRPDDAPQAGRVGAGTGARFGLGQASLRLPDGTVVAALVALNSAGLPLNPATCEPWALALELQGEFGLTSPEPEECAAARWDPPDSGAALSAERAGTSLPFNTTIAVVATDAALDQTQARRLAEVANSGLARAIRPVHNLTDGDAVFALATGQGSATSDGAASGVPRVGDAADLARLQAIYEAGADALARAVVHALIAGGMYCEQLPSACRARTR